MLAVLVHPAFSIPAAAAVIAMIAWYWQRLSAPDVPDTRRRLRRASMAVMVAFLFVCVGAMSFVNQQTNQSQFVVVWSIAITLLLVVIFIAFLDVINNLRIHRRLAARAATDARARLAQAAAEARQNQGSAGSNPQTADEYDRKPPAIQ
jgi:undecaprenyl pyrophosphate phosphatase UppP